MHLTYRYMRTPDLNATARIIRDRAAYDESTLPLLVRLWREMLADRSAVGMVVEDETRPAGARVVGCGMIVFVSDAFAQALKTTLPPFVGLQVLHLWRAGASPVLRLEQIRRDNSGPGLNLIALHTGWEDVTQQESRAETRPLQDKLWELLPAACRGYQLNEIFLEAFGEWQLQTALAAGFSLVNDYPASADKPPRVVLTSATRAGCTVGSAVSSLLSVSAPRFGFKLGEQDLLCAALLGEDDTQIARGLCVSLATVRKRWRELYERVTAVAPDFFPAVGPTDTDGARGTEKRRRLLQYLRAHPEELRPYLAR